MTLNWPWWVVLIMVAAAYWPATAVLAIASAGAAVAARGLVRVAALVLTAGFGALLLVAGYLGATRVIKDREAAAYDASTRQTLAHAQVIDGLALPPGSDVQWTGVDRSHLRMAGLPGPTLLLGASITWVQRSDDGVDWNVQLAEPQVIEGWMCAMVGVRLSPEGKLRSCHLAAGRRWRGWPAPSDAFLDLAAPDGSVELTLTGGSPIPAPEIGRAIPATGASMFNADGSLKQLYFKEEDPLLVNGVRLWNSVRWVYDPVTLGQSRRRRPVAVRGVVAPGSPVGASLAGEEVEVRTADGRISRVD